MSFSGLQSARSLLCNWRQWFRGWAPGWSSSSHSHQICALTTRNFRVIASKMGNNIGAPPGLFNTKSNAKSIGNTREALVMKNVGRSPFVWVLHPSDFSFTMLIAKVIEFMTCALSCLLSLSPPLISSFHEGREDLGPPCLALGPRAWCTGGTQQTVVKWMRTYNHCLVFVVHRPLPLTAK